MFLSPVKIVTLIYMQSTRQCSPQCTLKVSQSAARPKIAAFFEIEPDSPMEESAIRESIRWLDRDAFMTIACVQKPNGTHRLVIVLDKDYDEDALKKRPLHRHSIPYYQSSMVQISGKKLRR